MEPNIRILYPTIPIPDFRILPRRETRLAGPAIREDMEIGERLNIETAERKNGETERQEESGVQDGEENGDQRDSRERVRATWKQRSRAEKLKKWRSDI